jgi:hypothetical protein
MMISDRLQTRLEKRGGSLALMKNITLNAILRVLLGIFGLGCLFIGHYLFGIRIFLKIYSFIIIFISIIEGIGNISFSLRNKNWFWENHFAFRQENNKFFYVDLAIKLTGIFYLKLRTPRSCLAP